MKSPTRSLAALAAVAAAAVVAVPTIAHSENVTVCAWLSVDVPEQCVESEDSAVSAAATAGYDALADVAEACEGALATVCVHDEASDSWRIENLAGGRTECRTEYGSWGTYPVAAGAAVTANAYVRVDDDCDG